MLNIFKTSKTDVQKLQKTNVKKSFFHNSFEVGIFIKGLEGILDILIGFILLYINPERLYRIVDFLTNHEMSEDPNDVITNFIIRLSHEFSVNLQNFLVFYLILLGTSKIILVIFLRQERSWAYPFTVLYLSVFIFIQMHRYIHTHSVLLIFLTLFDIFMIFMTIIEYRKIKKIKCEKTLLKEKNKFLI